MEVRSKVRGDPGWQQALRDLGEQGSLLWSFNNGLC